MPEQVTVEPLAVQSAQATPGVINAVDARAMGAKRRARVVRLSKLIDRAMSVSVLRLSNVYPEWGEWRSPSERRMNRVLRDVQGLAAKGKGE